MRRGGGIVTCVSFNGYYRCANKLGIFVGLQENVSNSHVTEPHNINRLGG